MNVGNIQFHYKARREERPSRLIMQRALGLSPQSYRQQLSAQYTQGREQQIPQRNSVKTRNPSQYTKTQEADIIHPNPSKSRLSGNKDYVRNLISQRREINNHKKQEMIRKVKQLQQKVLPMIQNQRQQTFATEFGWQNRMEQKILKLQTHVDQMKNQLEIQMQKKLIQVQQRWQQKFQEIQAIIQANFYGSKQNI